MILGRVFVHRLDQRFLGLQLCRSLGDEPAEIGILLVQVRLANAEHGLVVNAISDVRTMHEDAGDVADPVGDGLKDEIDEALPCVGGL